MTVKSLNMILFAAILILGSCAGRQPEHVVNVQLNEISLENAPAINSYAFATHGGDWLILGGRIDGLHDHRPEKAYPPDSSNRRIWVMDVKGNRLWAKDIYDLPLNLSDQLQSTNMAFYQDGHRLVLIGGYGWSREKNGHITFPFLTVVNVPDLIAAVKSGDDPVEYFTQIHHEKMAVSGGYLGKMGTEYLLVFGNRFDGRYSTRPNAEHQQEYTHEIRKFELAQDGDKYRINAYEAEHDSIHFHRRDFNMLPQIFPNGDYGYTVFSGVFQYDRNFPWLYPVDITPSGYRPITGFDQKFSHYHGACVSMYSEESKQMANLFFGGMARFVPDPETGEIINDPLVPSVNTISQVTRFADGSLTENVLDVKMPGLLGASASFIPAQNLSFSKGTLIDYDKLPAGKNLIGYIYGGLESSHPNVFLQPKGVSTSTARLFEVYAVKPE